MLSPRRVDRGSLVDLLDTLAALATGRGLTSSNLEEDFGRSSDLAAASIPALYARVRQNPSPRTLSVFSQWQREEANASGLLSVSEAREWRELCSSFSLSPAPDEAPYVLFAIQTYFALVAKLVSLVVIGGAPNWGEATVAVDRVGYLRQLELGIGGPQLLGSNVIEPGLFSWYAHELDAEVTRVLGVAVSTASEYAAEAVDITPVTARDVLKSLYQGLMPRAIRHRLGEYYTPDWLAQRLVNQVTGSPGVLRPTTRVLDPACGSGTFLVEAIRRMIATANESSPRETLGHILRNVVGFDLSPMAVQAARVNYLLAIAPLLKYADGPVSIPVFMADSLASVRRGGLLDGNVFLLDTAEGTWTIPSEVVDSHSLPQVGRVFREAIAASSDADRCIAELRGALPAEAQTDGCIAGLREVFSKLMALDAADRDGFWWPVVSNAFAPVLTGRFDLIVGNPPWVSWETLPDAYRRQNVDQWRRYRLMPDLGADRRQASATARLDLSMLFVAKCVDQYLEPSGRLGFVITASVFQSELGGRGFRGRYLPDGGAYRFVYIDDMSDLAVFDDAANRTAVLIADKRSGQQWPIPVASWRAGDGPHSIPTSWHLGEVTEATVRRQMAAEPADFADARSPLMIMPRQALIATRPIRQRSPYLDVIREGINTRGANGIFYVEVLGRPAAGLLEIRNAPALGRNDEILRLQGVVEEEAVAVLLRGAEVQRNHTRPTLGVLFFHDLEHVSNPIPISEARRRWPLAYSFAAHFEDALRSRKPFRNFRPNDGEWLGLYSVTSAAMAEHKVVVREIATGAIAAAVNDARVIPDHKLYVIPAQSAEEARWVTDVINSSVVDVALRAFAQSTSLTGSFLRYVGIRDLSNERRPRNDGDAIRLALDLTTDEYLQLEAIARQELPAGNEASEAEPD